MVAILFLICVCGFGHRLEFCERQNIKVSYVCYGVSLKVKGCGNVDCGRYYFSAAMEIIHWRWLWIRLVGCLLFREMGLRALFNQLKLLCPLGDLGTAANNHVKWWEQWEMSTTIGGNLEN